MHTCEWIRTHSLTQRTRKRTGTRPRKMGSRRHAYTDRLSTSTHRTPHSHTTQAKGTHTHTPPWSKRRNIGCEERINNMRGRRRDTGQTPGSAPFIYCGGAFSSRVKRDRRGYLLRSGETKSPDHTSPAYADTSSENASFFVYFFFLVLGDFGILVVTYARADLESENLFARLRFFLFVHKLFYLKSETSWGSGYFSPKWIFL